MRIIVYLCGGQPLPVEKQAFRKHERAGHSVGFLSCSGKKGTKEPASPPLDPSGRALSTACAMFRLVFGRQLRYRAAKGSNDYHRTGHVLPPAARRETKNCLIILPQRLRLDNFPVQWYCIDKFIGTLQGRVKFPTGGKVRERASAESVQFRYRQYSLDGRRDGLLFHAP